MGWICRAEGSWALHQAGFGFWERRRSGPLIPKTRKYFGQQKAVGSFGNRTFILPFLLWATQNWTGFREGVLWILETGANPFKRRILFLNEHSFEYGDYFVTLYHNPQTTTATLPSPSSYIVTSAHPSTIIIPSASNILLTCITLAAPHHPHHHRHQCHYHFHHHLHHRHHHFPHHYCHSEHHHPTRQIAQLWAKRLWKWVDFT